MREDEGDRERIDIDKGTNYHKAIAGVYLKVRIHKVRLDVEARAHLVASGQSMWPWMPGTRGAMSPAGCDEKLQMQACMHGQVLGETLTLPERRHVTVIVSGTVTRNHFCTRALLVKKPVYPSCNLWLTPVSACTVLTVA